MILSFALFGCTKPEAPAVPKSEPTAVERELGASSAGSTPSYSLAKNPTVFDFAEFNEVDFPRGIWTVNQLIDKYGSPNELRINHLQHYGVAYVVMECENIRISFEYTDESVFSFFNNSSESDTWYYPLAENDKNLELEIGTIEIADENIVLPRDLRIGRSTKTEVMKAYGEEDFSRAQNEAAPIMYLYAFLDENGDVIEHLYSSHVGCVHYNFGESKTLESVEIWWWTTGD